MMFKVQISKQADSDLRGIYEYIAFELLSPENADGQLDRLEEAISKLTYRDNYDVLVHAEEEMNKCKYPGKNYGIV